MRSKKIWSIIVIVIVMGLLVMPSGKNIRIAEASIAIKNLELQGYTYDSQMKSQGIVLITISELEKMDDTLKGEAFLEHAGTKYLIKFDNLTLTKHGFYVGHGTAIPEGSKTRNLLDNFVISIQKEVRVVTGIFNDVDGKPLSFTAGDNLLSLSELKAKIKRREVKDTNKPHNTSNSDVSNGDVGISTIIPPGSGDTNVRGGGYNSDIRMEVIGVPTYYRGDPHQVMQTRLWAKDGQTGTLWWRVMDVYLASYVQGAGSYGFSFDQISPSDSSSKTSVSINLAYNAFSVTLTWTDDSQNTGFTSAKAEALYHPTRMYYSDLEYTGQSQNNGIAMEPYVIYNSGSPSGTYYATVEGYINWYEESLGYFWTDSISRSETSWSLRLQ